MDGIENPEGQLLRLPNTKGTDHLSEISLHSRALIHVQMHAHTGM